MNETGISATISTLGRCFVDFCQRQDGEFRIAEFGSRLAQNLPGTVVQQVFRRGGAHELYFTDAKEGNPQVYWRVTISGVHFLVPRPVNSERFDDSNSPKGFFLPSERELRPSALQEFWPAVLTGSGARWEVEKRGGINRNPKDEPLPKPATERRSPPPTSAKPNRGTVTAPVRSPPSPSAAVQPRSIPPAPKKPEVSPSPAETSAPSAAAGSTRTSSDLAGAPAKSAVALSESQGGSAAKTGDPAQVNLVPQVGKQDQFSSTSTVPKARTNAEAVTAIGKQPGTVPDARRDDTSANPPSSTTAASGGDPAKPGISASEVEQQGMPEIRVDGGGMAMPAGQLGTAPTTASTQVAAKCQKEPPRATAPELDHSNRVEAAALDPPRSAAVPDAQASIDTQHLEEVLRRALGGIYPLAPAKRPEQMLQVALRRDVPDAEVIQLSFCTDPFSGAPTFEVSAPSGMRMIPCGKSSASSQGKQQAVELVPVCWSIRMRGSQLLVGFRDSANENGVAILDPRKLLSEGAFPEMGLESICLAKLKSHPNKKNVLVLDDT